MAFSIGDALTPLYQKFNQAVDEAKAYVDSLLAVINWTVFTPTAAAGFTAGTCRYRKFGPIVEIRLEATYTGATVTAPADGNMANKAVWTGVGFPAGILPSQTLNVNTQKRGTSGDASPGARLTAAGAMELYDMHPTATLVNTEVVVTTAIYMVG